MRFMTSALRWFTSYSYIFHAVTIALPSKVHLVLRYGHQIKSVVKFGLLLAW